MADSTIDPSVFIGNDEDDIMFEEVAETPPAPAKKSRRAPRKGAPAEGDADASPASELPSSAAPATAAAEEPADPSAPIPRPDDVSAGSDPTEAPRRDRSRALLGAALGLSLFTSCASLGGLMVVSRTLAATQADRAHLADEQAALARLPAVAARLDAAATHAAPAAPVQTPTVIATPAGAVTADQLNHALDSLRLALDKRQPDGMTAVNGTLNAGMAEMAQRLDEIEMHVARLDNARPTPAPAPQRPPAAAGRH